MQCVKNRAYIWWRKGGEKERNAEETDLFVANDQSER